jgi:DNA-binding MarR family transcriptional regulator
MGGQTAGTSDQEILSAISEHYSPAVGTSDIADDVGVSRQAADRRLRSLQEDGLVEKYSAGRSIVWYLTDAGERYVEDIGGV